MKTLVILDDCAHVREAARYRDYGDCAILAFSLSAKIALDTRGIKSKLPHELTALPDLDSIGRSNRARVRDICDFIDRKLQEKLQPLSDNRLNCISAAYFRIKVFLDAVYTAYAVLEKLIEENKPKEIIFLSRDYRFSDLIEGEDSVIYGLIEEVFSKKYREIKIVFKKRCRLVGLRRRALAYAKNFIKKTFYSYFQKANPGNKNCCLVLENTHDVPYLYQGITKGVNFIRLNLTLLKVRKVKGKNEFAKQIREAFEELLRDQDYRNLFLEDESLFYFVNLSLRDYIISRLGDSLGSIDSLKQKLSDYSAKCLITAHCRLGLTDALLLTVAKSLSIPVVTYQEGGCAGYMEHWLYNIDVKFSDYFLVYGKGVKESAFIEKSENIMPVGSLRLDAIRNRLGQQREEKKPIYVVPGNLSVDPYQHYPSNGGWFSEAYLHQKEIIELLTRIGERFIIKTLENKKFLYEPLLNQHARIETRPLEEVISQAGAFIMDFPSTVLLECLLTDKPIAILYREGGVNFEPRALGLLKKRARISSNPDEFEGIIRSLSDDMEQGSMMVKNREFLDNYAIMDNTRTRLKDFFNNLLHKDIKKERL